MGSTFIQYAQIIFSKIEFFTFSIYTNTHEILLSFNINNQHRHELHDFISAFLWKTLIFYKTHLLQLLHFISNFLSCTLTSSIWKKKYFSIDIKQFLIGFVSFLQEVVLPKDQGSLGFSIIGGTDHSCVPFGANEPGIFISHVN